MIKKIGCSLLLIFLFIGMALVVMNVLVKPKPHSNTPEYLAAHGHVEGQVNEIRVGNSLLRFPPDVKYSPVTTKEIIKGKADQIIIGFEFKNSVDIAEVSHLDTVRIMIDSLGYEDPKAWDKLESQQEWKEIARHEELGLIEYKAKIPGGWGGVNYVAISDEDRTSRGSLIRLACSNVNNKVIECKSGFVTKNEVSINYFFNEKNLKNWKRIHDRVVQFVDSIIVD